MRTAAASIFLIKPLPISDAGAVGVTRPTSRRDPKEKRGQLDPIAIARDRHRHAGCGHHLGHLYLLPTAASPDLGDFPAILQICRGGGDRRRDAFR
jgi:hypothetical protein